MESDTRDRPRLTPKGERTRSRVVAAAARLIHERGVAGTTLEDVRAAAEVSRPDCSVTRVNLATRAGEHHSVAKKR